MVAIYMDESGELGFSAGSSEYFIITMLKCQSEKAVKKRVKKYKAKLINAGWPEEIEIKGTSVWGSEHNPLLQERFSKNKKDQITEILEIILSADVSVHYAAIRKENIPQRLRESPDGVIFNFYTRTLLERALKHDGYDGDFNFIVDRRNKEAKKKFNFDGYIQTYLKADNGYPGTINISHRESDQVHGIQAVDFISWALFRYFEHHDSSFLNTITPKIGYVDYWGVPKLKRPA